MSDLVTPILEALLFVRKEVTMSLVKDIQNNDRICR